MHAIDLMNNSVVDVSFFLFSSMFNQNIITEPSSETTDFSLVTHAGLFQSFSPFNIVHLPLLLSATSTSQSISSWCIQPCQPYIFLSQYSFTLGRISQYWRKCSICC